MTPTPEVLAEIEADVARFVDAFNSNPENDWIPGTTTVALARWVAEREERLREAFESQGEALEQNAKDIQQLRARVAELERENGTLDEIRVSLGDKLEASGRKREHYELEYHRAQRALRENATGMRRMKHHNRQLYEKLQLWRDDYDKEHERAEAEKRRADELQRENADLREAAPDCTHDDHQPYCRHYKGVRRERDALARECELLREVERQARAIPLEDLLTLRTALDALDALRAGREGK